MTPVEIFMMMYSLLIGLAMAGLLAGVGELLRGRSPPRWGMLVPLAAIVLFTTLLGVFADSYVAYRNVEMSLRSMGIPAIAGVLYYLAAILTIPREHDGWDDLDAYFMARKHLIFGSQFAAYSLIVFGVEVPEILARGKGLFDYPAYWVGNGGMMLMLFVPIIARRRAFIIAAMIGALVWLGVIYIPNRPMGQTITMLWQMLV